MVPVVSWASGRLLPSDAELFHEGEWLNDMCILYYFDVLLYDEYSRHNNWEHLLLVDPSTAFAIRFEDDEEDLALLIDGLRVQDRRCLIVPLNDNSDPALPCGGAHWSLLVLSRTALSRPWSGVYYDSAAGRKMPSWVSGVGKKLTDSDVRITVGECSKQSNCSDCGVYVLEFAKRILQASLLGDGTPANLLGVLPRHVSILRETILESIHKNGGRASS